MLFLVDAMAEKLVRFGVAMEEELLRGNGDGPQRASDSGSADFAQLCSASTNCRAFRPRRRAISWSSRRVRAPRAKPSMSPSGTSQPVSWWVRPGAEPTKETTGFDAAM